MQTQGSRLAFTILFVALVLVGGVLVYLYLNYSNALADHLQRRNHQQVAQLAKNLSGQLEGKIDEATAQWSEKISWSPCGQKQAPVSPDADSFATVVANNGRTVALYLSWKSRDPYVAYNVVAKNGKAPGANDVAANLDHCYPALQIRSLIREESLDAFDEVLLVDTREIRVLYQHNRHAIGEIPDRIFLLGDGTNRDAAKKEKKDGTSAPESDADASADPLRILLTRSPVDYSHKTYQRYCQPVPAPGAGAESDLHLALCGLVAVDRIGEESARVPLRRPRLLVLMLLLLVLFAPVLKVRYLGPRERIRMSDVRIIVICVFAASALATVGYLEMSLDEITRMNIDRDLETLAEDIESHAREELFAAFGQLDGFRKAYEDSDIWKTYDPAKDSRNTTVYSHARLSYPFVSQLIVFDETGVNIPLHRVADGDLAHTAVPDYLTDPKKSLNLRITDRRYFTKAMKRELWTFRDGDSGKTEKEARFSFESLRSRATGKETAVLAVPVGSDPNGGEDPKAVALLSTVLKSLIAPVLPGPYGFAVLNYRGAVTFHSDSWKNLQEDFLAEAASGRLESMVALRTGGHLSATYNGSKHRLYVRPLKDLNWTLITFRDLSPTDALDAEVALVWAAYFTLYCLWLVAVAGVLWVLGVVDLGGRLKWVWPNPALAEKYRYAGAACFVFAIVGAAWFLSTSSATTRMVLLLATPLLALLVVRVIVRRPESSDASRAGRAVEIGSNGLNSYVFMLFGILTVVATQPAAVLFADAKMLGMTAMLKEEQHSYATEWRRLREKELAKLGDSHPRCWGMYGIAYARGGCGEESLRTRATIDFGPPCPSRGGAAKMDFQRPASRFIASQLTDWVPALSRPAPLLFSYAVDWASNRSWEWLVDNGSLVYSSTGAVPKMRKSTEASKCFELESRLPSLLDTNFVWPTSSYRLSVFLAALFLVAVVLLVHRLLAWLVRQLLLVDVVTPPSGTGPTTIDPANLFLRNIEGEKIDELLDRPAVSCDFSALAEPGDWAKWLDKLHGTDVVIVEHLGHHVRDDNWERAKLAFLESLLTSPGRSIAIISRRNPYERREAERADTVEGLKGSSPPSAEILVRWARVMAQFGRADWHQRSDLPPGKSTNGSVEQLVRGMTRSSLRAMLAEYRRRHESIYRHSEIWAECTEAERLALVQLVQTGFLNSNNPERGNPDVPRRLAERNLVTRDPAICLTDQEFEEFIERAVPPQRVVEWERAAGPSSWSQLRIPLFAGFLLAGGFVLILRPEIGTTAIGIVTALGGLSAVMFRLIATFGALGGKAPAPGDQD